MLVIVQKRDSANEQAGIGAIIFDERFDLDIFRCINLLP